MSLACASWETRFWHAWWPHMRGTPAEATGCLVENHAELVGSDTLVIVDSQGNVVWDETGCSSIHAPSSWQSIQKGVPRLDLYVQWRMHIAYAFWMHTCVLACLSFPVQLLACVHVRGYSGEGPVRGDFDVGWQYLVLYRITNKSSHFIELN